MAADRPSRKQRGWSPSQRLVLTVLLAGLLVYAIIFAALNRAHVPDPQPPAGHRAHLLATRLDPNTAAAHELAMIPNIGQVRAQEIVAYRDRIRANDAAAIPFRHPDDLLRVKGIGWALRDHMRPHLKFPDDSAAASTAPAP